MAYTKEQLLNKIEKAKDNMNLFYKQDFINYRGKTEDSNEYYTEIVCRWTIDNLGLLDNIPIITREKDYFTKSHDGIIDNLQSNRIEEKIAMEMFQQSDISYVGKIIDYQTPLKNKRTDKAGKIDLLSYDGKVLRILELKEPESTESMLRCVMEGCTYLKTVDKTKLLKDFDLPADTVIKTNPLVYRYGKQYDEMQEERPKLKELIGLLDCIPLYFDKKEKYTITED